jgi:hypothetical protein
MSGVMRSVMNENQKSQSQVHVTALRCLRVKPIKQGLNDMTGNGRLTQHSRWVITLRPSALLEMFLFSHGSSTAKSKLYTIICDWGRQYRFDSWRYNQVKKMVSIGKNDQKKDLFGTQHKLSEGKEYTKNGLHNRQMKLKSNFF